MPGQAAGSNSLGRSGGTPQQIADKIAALQEAGVACLLLIFGINVARLRRFC